MWAPVFRSSFSSSSLPGSVALWCTITSTLTTNIVNTSHVYLGTGFFASHAMVNTGPDIMLPKINAKQAKEGKLYAEKGRGQRILRVWHVPSLMTMFRRFSVVHYWTVGPAMPALTYENPPDVQNFNNSHGSIFEFSKLGSGECGNSFIKDSDFILSLNLMGKFTLQTEWKCHEYGTVYLSETSLNRYSVEL